MKLPSELVFGDRVSLEISTFPGMPPRKSVHYVQRVEEETMPVAIPGVAHATIPVARIYFMDGSDVLADPRKTVVMA